MKNLLIAALVAISLTSCMGTKVRDNALLPAASMAWIGVRADLDRGIEDALEDGDLRSRTVLDAQIALLDAVLKDGADRATLRQIPWESTLLPYAVRGIQDRVDDGDVSQMIADTSLLERLKNFTAAFNQLMLARLRLAPSATREHWLPNGGGRVTTQAAIAVATTN